MPRTFDTYRLKGVVGRLFDIPPLSTRLVWETREWDPVAGFHDEGSDDDGDGGQSESPETGRAQQDGRWTQREVELEDGTREIGFWIEGRDASVRVESRRDLTG